MGINWVWFVHGKAYILILKRKAKIQGKNQKAKTKMGQELTNALLPHSIRTQVKTQARMNELQIDLAQGAADVVKGYINHTGILNTCFRRNALGDFLSNLNTTHR